MKIFLTGHRGYIGNVLNYMLEKQNFEVIGCDSDFYPQGFIQTEKSKTISLKKDIRDIQIEDLEGCFAVLHLAALSNDPLGELNSELTNDINFLATIRLANIAKKAGVERFIYSSSCSTYGVNTDVVTEDSPLEPLTAYAKSKVDSEKELLKIEDETFSSVILRNATAYGISASQRLDIVVNNLTCSAFTTGKVKLMSDGTAWRPLIHVEDMANAFIACLKSKKERVSGQIFNVGSNDENFSVRAIAETVESIIPNSKLTYSENANKDSRSYKVNFDKIKNQLEFKTKWTLKDGIKQIYEVIKKKEFSEKDFQDKKFYRVAYIKWLIENSIIDKDLRFN